jgi:hypothetical protein
MSRDMRKTVQIPNLTMREMMMTRALYESQHEEPAIVKTMEPVLDPINPAHYKSADGIEVIQVIEAFGLDYHRASALKYLLRAGRKDDELQDMKKCAWFINRAIQKLEGK